jgi:aldehyde:ferredoxin oxidoreductase
MSSRRGWGGIKEANAGGLSWQIARLGIEAIVVKGQPTVTDACSLLRVTKDGAEILPADDLAGMGMYEAYRVLRARHGNVAVVGVGPAGERRMATAGVCVNDKENTAGRYAGRGGLGAVTGPKYSRTIIVGEWEQCVSLPIK